MHVKIHLDVKFEISTTNGIVAANLNKRTHQTVQTKMPKQGIINQNEEK